MKFKARIHTFVFSLIVSFSAQSAFAQNEGNFGYVDIFSGENFTGASHRLMRGNGLGSLDLLKNGIWPVGNPMVAWKSNGIHCNPFESIGNL